MSITKTLGGDRLGAGKKQQVTMHGFERSTHDLGYTWRNTMAPGTLVPFLKLPVQPGDTIDINLGCDIITHPTIGPLFGSYKVQLDVFQCPIRLYQGQLHNNKLGIGMKMADVKLPVYSLATSALNTDDIDNSQINPSCLLNYLGQRGVGVSATPEIRNFNGVPLLSYWDIYKQYYSNKQEEVGAVIHRPFVPTIQNITQVAINNNGFTAASTVLPKRPGTPVPITLGLNSAIIIDSPTPPYNLDTIQLLTTKGYLPVSEFFKTVAYDATHTIATNFDVAKWGIDTVVTFWDYIPQSQVPQNGEPKVKFFPLENIDLMREAILQDSVLGPIAFNINEQNIEPYNLLLNEVDDGSGGKYLSRLASQEGLALKTYQSDLFNNWISTDWIDGPNGINAITSIDTSAGGFEIPTLILARKVYDMLNRIAVSGGTYDDWLDVQWGHERFTRCESPMYMGGLIKELVFQEVISNSAAQTEGQAQPLGTLAGRGKMAGKHKGGSITIKVDEPSYILGIVSLTPRIDYSQGNEWDIHIKSMDDWHKPMLDQIGFQELITEQMAWWDTEFSDGAFVQRSAGKQPAWINYMTDVNKVKGNFAIENNEMFMVLTRRYERDGTTGNIKDLTTYIDPVKFNHIFAQTSRDAMNFWVQIGVDMTARRKMSAKQIPNL